MGELGCSEEWTTERGAKRQIEGKEKVGGKNRRKEADEGIDKKKGRDRREEKTAKKEVREWAGTGVHAALQGKGGAGGRSGSQHNLQRITEGQFPLLSWLSGEGPGLRERKTAYP